MNSEKEKARTSIGATPESRLLSKFFTLGAHRPKAKRSLVVAAAIAFNLWPLYQAFAQCQMGTRRQCFIPPVYENGWLRTSYTIVSVNYVPPGPASYVEYGIGGQVGTTVSTTDSWQASIAVERAFELEFHGQPFLSLNVNFNNAFGGSTTRSIDQQASYVATTRINGPGEDDLNHDYDQIFLALSPTVRGQSWTDCSYAEQECFDADPPFWGWCECIGADVPRVRWSLDLSTSLPQVVLVGWLRGTIPMPQNVRDTLTSHGITPADYPEILAADPFADDPIGLTQPDPARFVPVGAYPYEYTSTTYTFRTNNNYTSIGTTGSSRSHTVGVTATGGALLLKLRVSTSFTYKHESQERVTTGTSDAETFFLTMPSALYSGPTIMYLYIDKTYKTFLVSPVGP